MPGKVFVNISVRCQLFLCYPTPPGWSIIDHLLFSSSSSCPACFHFLLLLDISILSQVVSVSIPNVTQGRALVLTTCNCIVRIVLVKSGDDDIHVVVVWTFTPGDDWSVVSATASVIGVDASDTYGN